MRCFILFVFMACSCVAGEEKKNTYVSKELGISISVPVTAKGAAPAYQVAMFYLEAKDGFAPNVNIMKQKYADTLEAYEKLSTAQFATLNMTILKKDLGKNSLTYEYKGKFRGKDMHWYARAFKKGEHIYLATAVTLEGGWERDKKRLIESINSFKIEK